MASLRFSVPNAQSAGWQAEANAKNTKPARRGRVLVLLAEHALATHNPRQATERAERATTYLSKSSRDFGLARYDAALAQYFAGEFPESRNAFGSLLKTKLKGYDRQLALLYQRHAAACARYHADHLSLGIPQPSSLDPLCAASSLAVCLRELGLPYDKDYVTKRLRYDGEGSSVKDIFAASNDLGVKAVAVTLDEVGLKRVPKPLVVHVERDHFIAVTEADKDGVAYFCSDCGAWPGGKIRLTWKQWRVLDPDCYIAIQKAGDVQAKALASLPESLREGKSSGAAGLAALNMGSVGYTSQIQTVLSALVGHVAFQSPWPLDLIRCGVRGQAPQCYPMAKCPVECAGASSGSGATAGDPVNLATGEEVYTPPSDIKVYNPKGPSVEFQRSYHSLSNTLPTGLGNGWTHSYNFRIERRNIGGWQQPFLVFPNRAQIELHVADPVNPPTSTTPSVSADPEKGFPLKATWNYEGSGTASFNVTFPDYTTWKFIYQQSSMVNGDRYDYYYPSYITDTVGRQIQLFWDYVNMNAPDADTNLYGQGGLDAIYDSDWNPLLFINYDGSGNMAAAYQVPVTSSDHSKSGIMYTCSVYNRDSAHQSPPPHPQNDPELTQTTQPAAVTFDDIHVSWTIGSSNPRFKYDYAEYSNSEGNETVAYLSSIGVPAPNSIATNGLWNVGQYVYAIIIYDAYGAVSTVTDANNNKTIITPNVDGSGALTSTTVQVKNSANSVVKQYTSFWGLPTMSESARIYNSSSGVQVTPVTFAFGDPEDKYMPSSLTTDGKMWSFTWDRYGKPQTTTAPDGTETVYTWDYTAFPLGNLASVKEGLKTATSFTYYPNNLLETVSTPIPGQIGTGSVQSTTYIWDALGNLSSVTTPGNNATTSRTYTFTYTDTSHTDEALSEPIKITNELNQSWYFSYDGRGNLTGIQDPIGAIETRTYNLADQLTQVSHPSPSGLSGTVSEIRTNAYPGGPITRVDGYNESNSLFRTQTYSYGAEGEFLGTAGPAGSQSRTYDGAYRPKTFKDGNVHQTSYIYDWMGRVKQIQYPLVNGSTDLVSYSSYSAGGNLIRRVDGRGNTTNYQYNDPNGFLSGITYTQDASSNVTITRDSYGRPTGYTDGTGTQTIGYDDLGDRISNTVTYTGVPAVTTSYTYYPDGTRKTMVNPAGTWTYLYNAGGLGTKVTFPTGNGSVSYSYKADGKISARTLSNGLKAAYAYYPAGTLKSLTNSLSGTNISSFTTLKYDAATNLTSFTGTDNNNASFSGNTTYTYDSSDRLTQETSTRNSGISTTFGYDAANNLTSIGANALPANNDNQLTGAGYTYDGNGNATTFGGTSATYDIENALTSLGSSLSFGTTADGSRAWKQAGANKTYYIYDGALPILELNASGSVTAVNLYGHDGLVQRKSASTTYYAYDPRGNAVQYLNSTGAITADAAYDPYGTFTRTGSIAADDPFAFSAQVGSYLDRESGDYLLGMRYYDPAVGRFLSRDTVSYAGGQNLYGYCGGNPISYVDPSGEFGTLLLGAIGAGIGALAGGIGGYISSGGDWGAAGRGALKGAVIGGVAGLTLGLAGPAIAGSVGSGIAGAAAAGAVADAAGDAAGQGLSILMGWSCGWDWFEFGMSAASGAAGGALGEALTPVSGGARFGSSTTKGYRKTFLNANPDVGTDIVVHHAVEQQVLKRYPGVVSEAEIHSIENLRGIPKEINSRLHLRQIRDEWDAFYETHPTATKEELLRKATEIDRKYGSEFNPPITGGR